MQIDLARTIAAPPPVAFATVADIANWPQIISSIERVELVTPGPIRDGTHLRLTRIRFGRQTTEALKVATIERPRRLRLVADDRGMRYELDHMIDAVFGLGSRLLLIFRSNPDTNTGRVLAEFMRTFMEIKLRDELEQDLTDFAAAIEAAQASDS